MRRILYRINTQMAPSQCWHFEGSLANPNKRSLDWASEVNDFRDRKKKESEGLIAPLDNFSEEQKSQDERIARMEEATRWLARGFLAHDMTLRQLMAMFYLTGWVSSGTSWIKETAEALDHWNDQKKKVGSNANAKIGPPHICQFQVLLFYASKKDGEHARTINEYVEHIKTLSPKNASESISRTLLFFKAKPFARDSRKIKVEILVHPDQRNLQTALKQVLKDHLDFHEMGGVAPPGVISAVLKNLLPVNK